MVLLIVLTLVTLLFDRQEWLTHVSIQGAFANSGECSLDLGHFPVLATVLVAVQMLDADLGAWMQGVFLSIDQTFLILMQWAYRRWSQSGILFNITKVIISFSIIDVSNCDHIVIVKCLCSNRIVLKYRAIHSLDHSLRVIGRRLLVNLEVVGQRLLKHVLLVLETLLPCDNLALTWDDRLIRWDGLVLLVIRRMIVLHRARLAWVESRWELSFGFKRGRNRSLFTVVDRRQSIELVLSCILCVLNRLLDAPFSACWVFKESRLVFGVDRVGAQRWSLDSWLRDDQTVIRRARSRAIVTKKIGPKTFIACFNSALKSIEVVVDPNRVLFNHAFLVEWLHLLLLKSLEVLFVCICQFHWNWYLFVLEIVDEICDKGPHFFLLVEHWHDKSCELWWILRDRLRAFVNDGIEKLCDVLLMEGRSRKIIFINFIEVQDSSWNKERRPLPKYRFAGRTLPAWRPRGTDSEAYR